MFIAALFAQTVPPSQLDKLVAEKDYPELERALHSAPLTPDERDYFEGIVADRKREVSRAIAVLEKVLPKLKRTSTRRAAEALRALSNDYFEAGRYDAAANAYADLLQHYAVFFNKAQRQGFSDNLHTFELLRTAPRQTVSLPAEFSVPAIRDSLGDIEVPLEIGGGKEQWIFDTGANITTIPLSTAKRLGLSISEGAASTQGGATGTEISLHIAIIPEVHFGSAVIRNVVALVMDDKALQVPIDQNRQYQIQGVLGYPVISELGSLTFAGGKLTIAKTSITSSRCAPMYVEELTPLIAARSDGRELPFSFDTGANSATLTSRYLRAFPKQFASLKKIKSGGAGAGGVRFFWIYQLPELHLQLGSATATLRNVSTNTIPLGNGLLDEFYGNLGQGLIDQFQSYTIDFAQMRLCLGEPAKIK